MHKLNAPQLLRDRAKVVARLQGLDWSGILRASLIERMTQCSKAGCKCMRGEKHGPAYYLTVTYPKGKNRQAYVSKEFKSKAEAWIANYHQVWTLLEEISRINWELLRLKDPVARG